MNRKLLISLGIIAVLLVYISVRNMKKSSGLPELSGWKGSAGEILIHRTDNEISIVNREGKWLINKEEYPADKGIINRIENKIRELKIVNLVSEKKFYGKYDLTPEKSTTITVKKDGKTLRKVIIGKKSSTNRHTYVRIDDRSEIYLAEGAFDSDLSKSAGELRDREILNIKKDAISAFVIKYRGRELSFTKKIEEKEPVKEKQGKNVHGSGSQKSVRWVCKGYEFSKLANNRIDPLISGFSPLTAADFTSIDKKSLTNPLLTVKLQAFNREIILNIYKKDKKNRYISTSSESIYTFLLDEWKVKKYMLNNIENLKEKI